MKTKFNNSELPHIWANQLQDNGSGSSMFFEGKSIYSYGYHFKIAEIITNKKGDKAVIYNSNSYSSSTAKHKSHVRGAINLPIYASPNCINDSKAITAHYVDLINSNIEKAVTARLNTGWILENAKSLCCTLSEYLEFSGYKPGKKVNELLAKRNNLLSPEQIEKIKAQKAAQRLALMESKKQDISDWINGLKSTLPHSIDKVFLRAKTDSENGIYCETSKGAKVSLKAAKTLFEMIQAKKDIKGHQIDGYTVISINGILTIGCHKIELNEIERFAKSQNWI